MCAQCVCVRVALCVQDAVRALRQAREKVVGEGGRQAGRDDMTYTWPLSSGRGAGRGWEVVG